MATQNCSLAADRKLGPAIDCKALDFTLAFELAVFVFGISAVFLPLAFFRVKNIFKADARAVSTHIHKLKIVRS